MRFQGARAALLCFGLALGAQALAQSCPPTVPIQGAAIAPPLPLFPADNWWNVDVSNAPIDGSSAAFINFIGANRGLHPDFGGTAGGDDIYGFPYAIVNSTQPKLAVTFDYWDESDGVNMANGQGIPFYPIPTQAISQTQWIEGGPAGTVDIRDESDRHLLMIDCTNRTLYELYNVWYSSAQQRWYAGSGAFFDMNTNNRRPNGWTSADAAGLAIFPGLVRYDEAGNAAVTEIKHAFRVTVRATNGHVYPASHTAGSTSGALPMGARLRLKTSVNGSDPALRTTDPIARKIFRAMQKYGLIVADNGSDMYISGTFDVRWNNGVLNPAFGALKASDFEVIQRGWIPSVVTASLAAVSASPNPVTGGQSSTGTVTLTSGAPAGGATVALGSASSAFTVPGSVVVPAGATSATFAINTTAPATATSGTLSASYATVTRTTVFTVNPPPMPTLSIADAAAFEGNGAAGAMSFTVRLSHAFSAAVGYSVSTASLPGRSRVWASAQAGSDYIALPLSARSIPAGQTSDTFTVSLVPDLIVEPGETFAVNLSAPSNATLADAQANGIILNDDAPPQAGARPSGAQAPGLKLAKRQASR